ncbi:hypothetical protein SAMN05660772_00415 [Pasteurella testudinis DSM 23072]|uniref:DUF7832 domain-containing protein n=1 Tax=Pasteurella testudinis DSM 23072 TaxID=1122938 RepID=A0A1W1UEN6_9PAST|nr:hypothetical protein [Pasteurella testudinis]SMB79556.1 hypothetical protein SAMN05660772_00415 [Pasteurella testudinis DSM 23072]SUB50723.1 Uncharacterised protein [Pasteurella testudinis]
MKYDDIKWHLNEDYPNDLPVNNALTHMGLFMHWIINNDLTSCLLKENFQREIEQVKSNQITGSEFIQKCCDEKLTSDDFNTNGNEFAQYYYSSDKYFDDYVDHSNPNLPTIFHEPNNLEKYNEISNIISKRYNEFLNKNLKM